MLKEYQKKRDFKRTSEPPPAQKQGTGALTFVVQEHAARRLHYDFRLEADGVLKSWAIPNGPSLDPGVKRLAVMVEDHPLDYASFEGSIPEGEYGAGQVIIWDRGTYSPGDKEMPDFEDRARAETQVKEGLEKGKLSFFLRGSKLKGSWALVKMQHKKNDWLLIKHRDGEARQDGDVLQEEKSVLSGLSLTDMKEKVAAVAPAAGPPEMTPEKVPGAKKTPFLRFVDPMLATLKEAPFSDNKWIFEPKLDGYRTLAFLRDKTARLQSRRGLDASAQFPLIIKDLIKQSVQEMVLDGEVVALDETGRPCFQCLQNRLTRAESGAKSGPAGKSTLVYYIFDILYLDGFDLQDVALMQRKKLLSGVLHPTQRLRPVDYYEKDGTTLFETAVNLGFEGVMAKLRDSVYEAGRRSRNWLKIKSTLSDDFVIGGYTTGLGNRSDTFGSLLLGRFEKSGKLHFEGQVGSGFDEDTLAGLRRKLEKLASSSSPFAGKIPATNPVFFVQPELAAEVKFAERTEDGYLRTPVFLRLREDKAPTGIHAAGDSDDPLDPPDPPARVARRASRRARTPSQTKPKSESAVDIPGLEGDSDSLKAVVDGYEIAFSHLQKELWPPFEGQPALTKRHLLQYLAAVAPYVMPHLRDRPLTLSRYPDGIKGQQFFQRHLDHAIPEFVTRVALPELAGENHEYLICNNAAALLWLGQMGNIELHSWFSRVGDGKPGSPDPGARFPDFIVFDLDPYIYAGNEAKGAEPELNRQAFAKAGEVAHWLKQILEGLGLTSFIKTSGRTGLHMYVPIIPQFEFAEVHAAAKTIASFCLQQHPQEITLDWSVEKRRGKIFIDYNQNVRSKTLASIYSPRASPQASVSTPLHWDEIGRVYPLEFTILNTPARLAEKGEIWKDILERQADLSHILKMPGN
jgi:bifunctional non-homologous end joining protein LigD